MRCVSTSRVWRWLLLFLLVVAVAVPRGGLAQSREYLLKAGFIEKFTHFVTWPGAQIRGDSLFRVAVLGENRFGLTLQEIFSKVKVEKRTVAVSYISDIDEIGDAKILFISGSVGGEMADNIFSHTRGKPILTIAETKGFGKRGAMINLLVVDNFIRYEINLKALGQSGLRMSSLLMNSAIIVEPDEK